MCLSGLKSRNIYIGILYKLDTLILGDIFNGTTWNSRILGWSSPIFPGCDNHSPSNNVDKPVTSVPYLHSGFPLFLITSSISNLFLRQSPPNKDIRIIEGTWTVQNRALGIELRLLRERWAWWTSRSRFTPSRRKGWIYIYILSFIYIYIYTGYVICDTTR